MTGGMRLSNDFLTLAGREPDSDPQVIQQIAFDDESYSVTMMSEADLIIQNNPHYGASSQLQAQFQ